MPLPQIRIYHLADVDVGQMKDVFRGAGITAANPLTQRVTALNDLGYQIDLDVESLNKRLAASHLTTFQWWLDASTDVVARYRRIDNMTVEEYLLDGTTTQQKMTTLFAVLSYFLLLIERDKACMFMGDMTGQLEDVAWDALAADGAIAQSALPGILGVPAKRAAIQEWPFGERLFYHDFEFHVSAKWRRIVADAINGHGRPLSS